MILDSLRHIRAPFIFDDGPMYHEFEAESILKEPWNAYSSLLFFIPIIYWAWRLRGEYKNHLLLVSMLPFLFLNGLGSTLFHAFRVHNAFLILDFLPAIFLNVIVASFLWTKVWKKWYWGLLSSLSFYAMGALTISLLPQYKEGALNISYGFVGLAFFIPITYILIKTNFYKWHLILLTVFSLAGALTFRILDYPTPNPFPELLPQGTHFLWHSISSLAVFFLGGYIYHLNKVDERV